MVITSKDVHIGTVIGYLTVTGFYKGIYSKKSRLFVKSRCVCGNEKNTIMKAFVLYSKNISCGCMKNINTSLDPNRRKDSPEWRAWRDMKDRCYNPNKKEYFRYGGRGIKVCDRWLNNYDNFYSDMGKRPNKGLSIDRIDVDGNYEPSNCKWSTAKEQANNTRRNIAYKMKNKIGEYGTV